MFATPSCLWLFLVFINDLPKEVDCQVELFSGDVPDVPIWCTRLLTARMTLWNSRRTLQLLASVPTNGKWPDIHRKIMAANQQFGIIKRALYWAPINVKLLTYKTLCLPHLEYAAAAWDSSSKKDISDIEQLQDQAVRFIAGIKGRDGVEDAKTRLGLIPLHKRRRDQRLRLLMRILAKEEHHSSLSESYNEIMKQPATTMTTRSQTRGIPATFRTNSTQYHNSFFPTNHRWPKR